MLIPLIWPSSAHVILSKGEDVAGIMAPGTVATEDTAGSVLDIITTGGDEEVERANCAFALISMGSEQQYQQMDGMSPPYVLKTPEQ